MDTELWWLDFVDDAGHLLGASVVRAPDFIAAVREAHRLETNPGGTVIAYYEPEIPEDMINRFTPVEALVARGFGTPKVKQ